MFYTYVDDVIELINIDHNKWIEEVSMTIYILNYRDVDDIVDDADFNPQSACIGEINIDETFAKFIDNQEFSELNIKKYESNPLFYKVVFKRFLKTKLFPGLRKISVINCVYYIELVSKNSK